MNLLQVCTTAVSTNDIARFINRVENQVTNTDSSLQDIHEKRRTVSEEIASLQRSICDCKTRSISLQDSVMGLLADTAMLTNDTAVKEDEESKLVSAIEALQEKKRCVESLIRQQREEHVMQCKEFAQRRELQRANGTWILGNDQPDI
eukprot:jgi/Botrbrau1/17800/Bobra.0127s0049.1